MERRNFIKTSALTAGLLTLSYKDLLAMVKDPAYKINMLTNEIGTFTEKGGTIVFLLTKDGAVIVDAQFPEQAGHLIDELKKRSEKPFQLLINTHHHGDHTSGNIAFKGLVPHVVAHANSLVNQTRVATEQKSLDKQLFPDQTFTDSWRTKVGHEKIRAYYFGPGHTNGDAIIHFEHGNVAHMGDLMFNRRYAYIDKSAGANIHNWIIALDKALNTFDNKTQFVFGHAFDPVKINGNKDDLKAMQNYLSKLLDFVGGEIKAGKTKEEILLAKSIPGVAEWQGDGIERGLTAAYIELTTNQ